MLMRIKLLIDCNLGAAGKVIDVADDVAATLISFRRAEPDAPSPAIVIETRDPEIETRDPATKPRRKRKSE